MKHEGQGFLCYLYGTISPGFLIRTHVLRVVSTLEVACATRQAKLSRPAKEACHFDVRFLIAKILYKQTLYNTHEHRKQTYMYLLYTVLFRCCICDVCVFFFSYRSNNVKEKTPSRHPSKDSIRAKFCK